MRVFDPKTGKSFFQKTRRRFDEACHPYRDGNGQNQLGCFGKKVVRGRSWYDRPDRCRSAFRQAYPQSQVYRIAHRFVEGNRLLRRKGRGWRDNLLSGCRRLWTGYW